MKGTEFKAFTPWYTGKAKVLRQKKGGLYLCQGDTGVLFDESKTRIMKHVIEAEE